MPFILVIESWRKKKTKILQNEKNLWWLDLKETGEMKCPEPCPHDRIHKDFCKTIPSFDSSVVISSILPWLLLLNLAIGLVIVATTNHLHHVGTLLVFMRWPFPRTKNSYVYLKKCWQKPVRTRVLIGFITPRLWVIEILLQISDLSWNYLCISANASIV